MKDRQSPSPASGNKILLAWLQTPECAGDGVLMTDSSGPWLWGGEGYDWFWWATIGVVTGLVGLNALLWPVVDRRALISQVT